MKKQVPIDIGMNERLKSFAVEIIKLSKYSKDYAGEHLFKQAIRSSTSASLNYGEMMFGASRRDFLYKGTIVLKELSETLNCIDIINRVNLTNKSSKAEILVDEAEQLVKIMSATLRTIRGQKK